MEGARKLLISQVTDPSNLSSANILQLLYEQITGLLHLIVGFFTYLPEKLIQVLHFISQKFDEIFPPETRSNAIHLWFFWPVVLIAVWCCCPCCYQCCFNVFKAICRCCQSCYGAAIRCFCCFPRAVGKMMKAPGRGGVRMARSIFEANPRAYFINLRAGNPLTFR